MSGRFTCLRGDVVAVGLCAFSLFQVGPRFVSGRRACFRADVVAFGLCVCVLFVLGTNAVCVG